jgi:hypothetical protein
MRRSTLILIAALAAVSTASPAFAQAQSHEGSVLPHYYKGDGTTVWGEWAPPQAPDVALHRGAKISAVSSQKVARSEQKLYMMAPSGAGFAESQNSNRDNPAFTGGGSLGYNQNLKNY